ncbi:hypothetical protein ACOMHN_037748 [Nucella lapillus]
MFLCGSLQEEDLNPELVTQYLQQNQDFLDDYVHHYVNTDQLEKWLSHKARHSARLSLRHRNDHNHLPVNGEVSSEGRSSSLSKWKSRIQSSKGRVLQELSKEMNQQHGKLAVLLELSACVAAAISSDGHNLYTVDENKEEMSHVSTDSGGHIIEDPAQQTTENTTVAAHVAVYKEPVRMRDFATDSRFPEGLGSGSNRANCVLALPITDGNGLVLGVVEFYRYSRYREFSDEEEEAYAQTLVSADRASIFLLDHKTRELYARIFDVGSGGLGTMPSDAQRKEISKSCQSPLLLCASPFTFSLKQFIAKNTEPRGWHLPFRHPASRHRGMLVQDALEGSVVLVSGTGFDAAQFRLQTVSQRCSVDGTDVADVAEHGGRGREIYVEGRHYTKVVRLQGARGLRRSVNSIRRPHNHQIQSVTLFMSKARNSLT